jgi:hypothetical protein
MIGHFEKAAWHCGGFELRLQALEKSVGASVE